MHDVRVFNLTDKILERRNDLECQDGNAEKLHAQGHSIIRWVVTVLAVVIV